jgi:hypothetical protein
MATNTATMIQKQMAMDADLLDRALNIYSRDELVHWLREHLSRILRDTAAPGIDQYADALRLAPTRTDENNVLVVLYNAGVEQMDRVEAVRRAGLSMNRITVATRTEKGNAEDSPFTIPTIRRERGVATRMFSLSLPSAEYDLLRNEAKRRGIPQSFLIHTALYRTVHNND